MKKILLFGFILGLLTGLVYHFDFTPYYPVLIKINMFCEKYTSKNIAEIGVILLLVIPMTIFVIKERKTETSCIDDEYRNIKHPELNLYGTVKQKIKYLLCSHDFIMLDNSDSFPKEGEILNASRLHKCSKCGKEKINSSGWEG